MSTLASYQDDDENQFRCVFYVMFFPLLADMFLQSVSSVSTFRTSSLAFTSLNVCSVLIVALVVKAFLRRFFDLTL